MHASDTERKIPILSISTSTCVTFWVYTLGMFCLIWIDDESRYHMSLNYTTLSLLFRVNIPVLTVLANKKDFLW